MSDEPTPQGTPAPIPPPSADPPAPPPASPTAGADPSPTWLPERLKQARQAERKALLESFGVKDGDELKTRLQKLQELETSQLSEQERTAKMLDELRPKAEAGERVSALFASVVEKQFAELPEQTQAAIDARANGDAEKRWDLMQVVAATAPTQPVSPSAPRPANTPAAPPAPTPGNPQTAFDRWQALKASDATAASIFYQSHSSEIDQSRRP